jgi:abortive infection bacteriophage resistance protein
MFKYLSVIENNIKSITAYQLSLKYGYKEKDYLNKHTFTIDKCKSRQVNDLVRKMQRQIRVNTRQHSATSHYINNYGYIPLWVLVKVLSFGIVAETFTILKKDDQDAIANIYNMNSEDFALYMSLLSNYRNICAHEDIIFDNKTQRGINDNIYHYELDIPKMDGEYLYGKNDLFAVIIMLKQLLSQTELTNLVIELKRAIDNLAYNLKVIPIDKVLDRMGFPLNWEKISEIEKKVLSNA